MADNFLTMQQYRDTHADDIDANLIDEFIKNDYLYQNLPFHMVATPNSGGTIAHIFSRLTEDAVAGFRALNGNYTPSSVPSTPITLICKIFGGQYEVDTVLDQLSAGQQVVQQSLLKVKATKAIFTNSLINGSVSDNALDFDGLSVQLTGAWTEVAESGADLTVQTKEGALAFLGILDDTISRMVTRPSVLLVNRKTLNAFKNAIRLASFVVPTDITDGYEIAYNGIPVVDLGYAYNSGTAPVIAEVVDSGHTYSDIYAVTFGLNEVCALSPAGQPILTVKLPNFNSNNNESTAKGRVEMVAALAVKNTRAAAVLRQVKIA